MAEALGRRGEHAGPRPDQDGAGEEVRREIAPAAAIGPAPFFFQKIKKSWPRSRLHGALSHVKHYRPVPEKEPPMQLFSWLHKWMSGRPYTRPTPARKRTPRFRPQLEALEDRWMPSTLTVTSPKDHGRGTLRAEIAAAQTND